MKEVLEFNDWVLFDGGGFLDFGDFEDEMVFLKDDLENMDFGYDKMDFEGLKKVIWENSLINDDVELLVMSSKDILVIEKDEKKDLLLEDIEKVEVDDDDVVRVEKMMRKL